MTKVLQNIDEVAENAMVALLSNIFGEIAVLDVDTVHDNMMLAAGNGFSVEDRSIPTAIGNYLISNFAVIYIGLIINPEFRKTFCEAVSVEISLQSESKEKVLQMRKSMQIDKSALKKPVFIINFGKYNDNIYKKFNERLAISFEKVERYDDAVSEIAGELTKNDKIMLGFVMSNFMYLIRAFAQNPVFIHYVRVVVKSVKKELNIE